MLRNAPSAPLGRASGLQTSLGGPRAALALALAVPGNGPCLAALFVSLGGVSYGVATGFIDGREIKNNAVGTKDLTNNDVRGRDVRNNTLTGADVNEARLGKVPNAGAADTAASATNANTLDGKDSTDFGPLAYARINGAAATGGDTVDDARSKKITDANVVHPQRW